MEIQKDFDTWNIFKKKTHSKPEVPGVHEREIWWVSFGINIGVEIDGKHGNFERPALVLKRFNKDMVWVLPTTLQSKNDSFHQQFNFEGKNYFVILTQIRTVSSKRFLRKVGMIPMSDFEIITGKVSGFIRPAKTNENPPLSGLSRRPKP